MLSQKYQGDDAYQSFLNQYEDLDLNARRIKIFILGALMGPELPPPSVVMEQALDFQLEELNYSSEDEAQVFHNHFFCLWNHMAQFIQPDNQLVPDLGPEKTDFSSKEEKIKYIIGKSELLIAFFDGLELSKGDQYFSANLNLMIASFGLCLLETDLGEVVFDFEESGHEEITNEEVEELLLVIGDMHRIWESKFVEIAQLLTSARIGKLELEDPEIVHEKFKDFIDKMAEIAEAN